jgi:hypothetical protein
MGSTLSKDFAETPIIFIGRLISKVPLSTVSIDFSTYDLEYTMEVEETFKVISH